MTTTETASFAFVSTITADDLEARWSKDDVGPEPFVIDWDDLLAARAASTDYCNCGGRLGFINDAMVMIIHAFEAFGRGMAPAPAWMVVKPIPQFEAEVAAYEEARRPFDARDL